MITLNFLLFACIIPLCTHLTLDICRVYQDLGTLHSHQQDILSRFDHVLLLSSSLILFFKIDFTPLHYCHLQVGLGLLSRLDQYSLSSTVCMERIAAEWLSCMLFNSTATRVVGSVLLSIKEFSRFSFFLRYQGLGRNKKSRVLFK